MPITFLALIAPALKTLPHVVAALTSTCMALAFSWIPYSLGLIVAAVLAMVPLSRNDFFGPMAVAIMGGLIVATALTASGQSA